MVRNQCLQRYRRVFKILHGMVNLNHWTSVQRLRLALSKGPIRVGVSVPSSEEVNMFSFW
jgi:hypothetical protein